MNTVNEEKIKEKVKKTQKNKNDNCGIYGIFNLINGKVYIGKSVNIEKRWNSHFNYLKCDKHKNSHLQKSYNKYGKENFEYKILKLCKKEKLDYWEKYFIYDRYNSFNPNCGYNKTIGGEGGAYREYSMVINKWINDFVNGNSLSKIAKQYNISHSTVRKYVREYFESQENGDIMYKKYKEKIIKMINKNRKHSSKSRKNMSNAHRGKPTGRKGKGISEKHRKSMEQVWQSNKGKKKYNHLINDFINLYNQDCSFTEIGNQFNISSAVIGRYVKCYLIEHDIPYNVKVRKCSEETKRKIGLKNKGKKHTEEFKKRISESGQKYKYLLNNFIDLYNKGYNYNQIGKQFGISRTIIRNYIKRHLASQQNPCYNTPSETI